MELYETGLVSKRLWAQDASGRRSPLPIADWTRRSVPGDAGLLARCSGPTLDIGCGPGRLVAALATAGCDALGIDISAAAIARACVSGGKVLRRSVFGAVPRTGWWHCALLADGNIGIGGDPHLLLRRTRQLLAPEGRVLVELAPPGTPTTATSLRLQDASGRVSDWFPWARVGVDGITELAAASGFAMTECWQSGGRWFGRLSSI